jgi:toxin HigB-1
MILSFACKETERIWMGEFASRFPSNIQAIARRKLRLLDAATALTDLTAQKSFGSAEGRP